MRNNQQNTAIAAVYDAAATKVIQVNPTPVSLGIAAATDGYFVGSMLGQGIASLGEMCSE
jgi:hypothetical protein